MDGVAIVIAKGDFSAACLAICLDVDDCWCDIFSMYRASISKRVEMRAAAVLCRAVPCMRSFS